MAEEIAPERKRFGEVAVSLGLVSEASLREALAYQEKEKAKGVSTRLGQLLIDLGYLQPSDAFYVFQAQHATNNIEGRFLGQKLQKIKLIRFLGKGGMGEVYMGENVELDRKVAVKFLSPALAADSQYVQRFLWEAQAAAKLYHTNIVHTYDVGAFESTFYILMEYVEGKSLAEMIRQRLFIPVDETVEIICQAARGLDAAHKGHIIHRDIKPENLMITPEGVVKIMDFGLARSLDQYKGMTATGQVMGTPEYISPEACQGLPIDARSDIYSLGITFYEALTGNPPFHSKSPMAIMLDHISTTPVSPDRIIHTVPPQVSRMVTAMLAKKPEERYANMACIVEDIEEFQRQCKNKEKKETKKLDIVDDEKKISPAHYHFSEIRTKSTEFLFRKVLWGQYKIVTTLLTTILLAFVIAFLYFYYVDKTNYQEYLGKESSLPLKDKIRLWNDFLDKYPDSRYMKSVVKRTEGIRETLFFQEIQQSATEAKSPALALQKWQLYLNIYPNGKYSSQVQDEINSCKAKIPVLLKIETAPPGASFLIDGKIEGKTPCIVSLNQGQTYVFNFYLQGYQPVVMKFSLTSGDQKNLLVKLIALN